MWRAIRDSNSTPTYAFSPCELDGVRGGYVADMCSRSARRRRLSQHGFSFSKDPFPRLREGCEFVTDDWGSFSLRFVITAYSRDEIEELQLEGERLATLLSTFRFGGASQKEVEGLSQCEDEIAIVPGNDAQEARDAIKKWSDGPRT